MTLVDAAKIIDAALRFLPAQYDSTEARAMLLAIGLQESEFRHRQQINGPANGYWQFEMIGDWGKLLLLSGSAGIITSLALAAGNLSMRVVLKRLGLEVTVNVQRAKGGAE